MLFEDLAICSDIYDLMLKYPLTCWNAKGKILFMNVFQNHWKGLDNNNFLLQQRKLKTSTMPSLLSTRTTVERWKQKVGIFIFYFPFPFWLILGRLREDPYEFMYSAFGHCPNRIWPTPRTQPGTLGPGRTGHSGTNSRQFTKSLMWR